MKTLPIYIIMSLLTAAPLSVQAQISGQDQRQDSCLMNPLQSICQIEDLKLYVGPQSVEPGEDIFIAVETLTADHQSAQATSVIVIDEQSGRRYMAPVKRGLAYIEIKAPNQSGRLTFRAETGKKVSQPAEVLVHAGQADDFDLHIEKNKGQLFVWSSIIADKFGNFIDDGITATIDLVNEDGLYASLQTLSQDGRIGLHIPCDDIKTPQSRIRAKIGQAVQDINIPTYFCGGQSNA